jgi:cyclase
MYRPRVIPVLLMHQTGLFKTTKFKNPVYIGDPINAVKIFNEAEADELIFLDIDKKEEPDYELIKQISEETMMPFSYGGSIRNPETAKKVFDHGTEKVIINSACFENYKLIELIAKIYGSQAVVIGIDVRKEDENYHIYTQNGLVYQKIILEEHIRNCEIAGAGEFMIQSIDKDGTMEGYDLSLIHKVSALTCLPVIACGGAKSEKNLLEVIRDGNASAAAAGSMFVFVGINRAVLINYPEPSELLELFNI